MDFWILPMVEDLDNYINMFETISIKNNLEEFLDYEIEYPSIEIDYDPWLLLFSLLEF